MLVQVLGTVQVTRPARPDGATMRVVPVERPARRRLLSLLAMHGGDAVPIDRVIEEFWVVSRPARPRPTLHTHVCGLRHALGADLILTEGDAYRLDLSRNELDIDAFETGAKEALLRAADGSSAEAVEVAEATLSLWRGDPFLELPDHQDAVAETARLSELRRTLRQVRAEGLLSLGRAAEAVAELEPLVLEHPLHERLWEDLMRGRVQLGHHGAALQTYHRARGELADLGLDPGPTLRGLQTRALRHQEESRRPPCELPTPLTRFLGRGSELAELESRLDRHRLVTVTGLGGVGKTRTAVEAARRQRDGFPGGTWFVSLAEVGQGESVEHAVAGVLGLRTKGDLTTALRHHLVGGPVLLVLDNCEHVRQAVSSVARRLLLTCPGVHLLATSREPVGTEGEQVFYLPPMTVPQPGAPAQTVPASDAVRLFLDRAQIVDPLDQEPGVMNAVAEVCRRLDGVPLALALAAAEVRGLGMAGVLRQVADLGRLAGDDTAQTPRHRTLDAVIDWSYATLEERERTVLRRLAVFRGSFAVDAAEAVAGSGDGQDSSVLPVLGRLVQKSLLTRSGLDPVRYQLLEVVRQYADRRLGSSGERTVVADRHARWYAELARALWLGVQDRSVRPARTSPLLELPNLRQARQQLEAGGHRSRDLALLSGAIAHGISIAGLVGQALQETLRALEEGGDWPEWEVDLRNRAAYLLGLLNDDEGARAQLSRACEVARTMAPSGIAAWTFGHLGRLELRRGSPDYAQALNLAQEAVDTAVASGDQLARTRCRGRLGHTLAWVGRGVDGVAELRAAVGAARRAGDPLTEIELSGALFQALLLTRGQRRHGPGGLAGELHDRFVSRRSPLVPYLGLPWLVHALLQSGRWEDASRDIVLMDGRHHEGDDLVAAVLARTASCWVQGRYDDAAAVLRELAGASVNPHWFDRYYPLRIEVLADAGDLDGARRVAEEYLALDVGEAREAGKLGAVSALARVEAMAADLEPAALQEHTARAGSALALGQALLERFPPPYDGSLAMETAATHLILARAELTRLTGADPRAWELARESADHVRFRLYAGLGLAQSRLAVGEVETARREAAVVHARSAKLGAGGFQHEAARLLAILGGPAHRTGPSGEGPVR